MALPNALGNPLRAWDNRDHVRRWTFDALNRPTHAYIQHAADDEKLQTRTVYGESLGVAAPDTNHLGQVYRVYDSAGVFTAVAYDFKGSLLENERRFAADYTGAPDWIDLAAETDPGDIATAAAALLESEAFTTSWTFDALGRVTTQTTPDASVTTQTYGAGGRLQSIAVNIRGAVTATDIITNLDYNERGQRILVAHGNGSETTYTYDPKTFRVRRIYTQRPNIDPDVQDLRYHYDPSGNITRIRDNAQQGVFFANAYVDATQSFTYDPTYRLTEATGREHAALTVPTPEGFTPISHPQDSTAQDTYTQSYQYDAVGNIQRMIHANGIGDGWTRGYAYHPGSNRLRATSVALDDLEDPDNYTDDSYDHDAHGNMIAMSAIPGGLTWDEDDRLQKTDQVGGGVTFYVYDGTGQRVRKVQVKNSTRKQRLYFGAWELYREEHNINTTPVLDLERATLHVHDDTGRICLIETKTAEDDTPIIDPANIARYQYSNHLGTASLELDDGAEVISYEEFHPYGTSSYSAANSAIEVSPKRYRYTGQERDEETGLAYHNARYYIPWLGRWNSSDPIGLNGGINLFAYASNQPVSLSDPDGTSPHPSVASKEQPQYTPNVDYRGEWRPSSDESGGKAWTYSPTGDAPTVSKSSRPRTTTTQESNFRRVLTATRASMKPQHTEAPGMGELSDLPGESYTQRSLIVDVGGISAAGVSVGLSVGLVAEAAAGELLLWRIGIAISEEMALLEGFVAARPRVQATVTAAAAVASANAVAEGEPPGASAVRRTSAILIGRVKIPGSLPHTIVGTREADDPIRWYHQRITSNQRFTPAELKEGGMPAVFEKVQAEHLALFKKARMQTVSIPVTDEQLGQANAAFHDKQWSGPSDYKLKCNSCSTNAADVLRRASVPVPEGVDLTDSLWEWVNKFVDQK